METSEKIARLLAAKVLGQPLTESEQLQVEAWLQASEANRALYERIRTLEGTEKLLKWEEEGYGKKMAERFKRQLVITPPHELGHRPRRIPLSAWLSSAAAVALLLVALTCYQLNRRSAAVSQQAVSSVIRPGKTGAMLTLANGESVRLQPLDKEMDRFIDSVYTRSAAAAEPAGNETAWHTLTIPAGEEFFCRLDDGTSVWLNSGTELRFPNRFGKGERRVCLQGEAFFDVAKEGGRPFIVSTRQGNIRVYGTRFNVTGYADALFSAVLVEGSIGFTTPQGEEVRLRPSERLTYNESDGTTQVATVDTSLYTAWVEHLFVFEGQPLEEIMATLSRWYDCQVTFTDDDIRRIRLSGQLYRHEDIRILLDSYERTTGLRFQIEGKHILITY